MVVVMVMHDDGDGDGDGDGDDDANYIDADAILFDHYSYPTHHLLHLLRKTRGFGAEHGGRGAGEGEEFGGDGREFAADGGGALQAHG